MLKLYQEHLQQALFFDTPENMETFQKPYFDYENAEFLERFNVYRHNIIHSLTDILKGRYELCVKLIGEDAFADIAESYIQNNLPHRPELYLWAYNFPNFFQTKGQTHGYEYWGDLAQFEHNMHSIYYVHEGESYTTHDMGTLLNDDNLENHPITFVEGITLQTSSFDLLGLIGFLKDCCEYPQDISKTTYLVFFKKQDFTSNFLEVSSVFYEALNLIYDGQKSQNFKTFGDVANVFTKHKKEDQLPQFFEFLFTRHLLKKDHHV